MDHIIAGRFRTKVDADRAAASLRKFIDTEDICIFQNNAPGQHAAYPIGGDEYADPGADLAAVALGNENPQDPMRRPAGVMLAARIAKPSLEQQTIDTLHKIGAADIERAEGKWKNGDWTDFDPVAKPRLVDSSG
jgi:hypothetical protein